MLREEFINAKRIVIKLGTNVLRNSEGEVAISRIYSFIEDMAKLVKQGKEVILVTSGAVGLGKKKLNLESTAEDGVKQACAAVGQSRLMSFYENGFGIYDVPIAQILLTEDDFSLRYRYLSLRTTLNKILEFGVVPIINQNDTVSTIEMNPMMSGMKVCFADNDKLSALVASELDADLLILLSDINGLYTANPKVELSTRPESFVGEIENWNKAEAGLKEAMDRRGMKYEINEGDGAFYGPKIDFKVKDAIGRTWQCATIQLDFNLPARFDIKYQDKDGSMKTPIMLHRVIFGSMERFHGILIEHYAGAFPTEILFIFK